MNVRVHILGKVPRRATECNPSAGSAVLDLSDYCFPGLHYTSHSHQQWEVKLSGILTICGITAYSSFNNI